MMRKTNPASGRFQETFTVSLCLCATAFCLFMFSASLSKTLRSLQRADEWKAFIHDDKHGMETASDAAVAYNGGAAEPDTPSSRVTLPRPNARYLKKVAGPFRVSFVWNRHDIDPEDLLKLEIAEDRNFSRVVRFLPAYDVADAALDAGLWFWRLSYGDELLDAGRFTVTDAAGPALFSPAMDQLYQYRAESAQGPELLFRWSEVMEASHYLLEAAGTPGFEVPVITERIWGTFFVSSSLGPGTWYWRVRPVFPGVYEGESGVSAAASFRIE